jgi:hypothetical protein
LNLAFDVGDGVAGVDGQANLLSLRILDENYDRLLLNRVLKKRIKPTMNF